jgi:hypothetical protein
MARHTISFLRSVFCRQHVFNDSSRCTRNPSSPVIRSWMAPHIQLFSASGIALFILLTLFPTQSPYSLYIDFKSTLPGLPRIHDLRPTTCVLTKLRLTAYATCFMTLRLQRPLPGLDSDWTRTGLGQTSTLALGLYDCGAGVGKWRKMGGDELVAWRSATNGTSLPF